jgi:hypothetical protein
MTDQFNQNQSTSNDDQWHETAAHAMQQNNIYTPPPPTPQYVKTIIRNQTRRTPGGAFKVFLKKVWKLFLFLLAIFACWILSSPNEAMIKILTFLGL